MDNLSTSIITNRNLVESVNYSIRNIFYNLVIGLISFRGHLQMSNGGSSGR